MCHVCGADYVNIVDFNSHIASHEGITYKCPTCDKTFRSENSLKNHRRAEDSGKLHTCQQCGKSFQLKTSLLNHIKTHSITLYACQVFSSSDFTTKSYSCYREHNKYGHNTTKDFKCMVCKKAFQTPSKMHSHGTKQHGPFRKTHWNFFFLLKFHKGYAFNLMLGMSVCYKN